MERPIDPDLLVRLTLRNKALEAVLELPPDLATEVREVVTRGSLSVVMMAVPADRLSLILPPLATFDERQPANQCERDILTALKSLGSSPSRRFVRERIEKEIERLKLGLHGYSTLTNGLARLVHAGVLVNAHDRKGYGLILNDE